METALPADFENVSCILCGPGETIPLSNTGQFGLPANVVICKNCGLAYLSPRWNRERYTAFYKYEYDKFYRQYLVKKSPAVAASAVKTPVAGSEPQKAATAPALERMKNASLFPEQVRHFLDIGSGNGGLIAQARNYFPSTTYYAIEASDNCRQPLERAGVKLISSDEASEWHKEYTGVFDLVHMRHVLEHFLHPHETLRKVRDVLSDDGVVYIAVPNSMKPCLPMIDFYFRVVHTYYFNKETLHGLMRRVGLEPVFTLEGDASDPNELVVVARKAEPQKQESNSFQAQYAVYMKSITHETSLLYRLRQGLRRLLKRKENYNTAL